MSIRFSQGKLKGEERQSIIQEIQRQAKAAALAAVKPVFTAFLEAEVTAKLGRGKREARHISGQAREIDWQCASCGSRDANQFMRDGHDRRNLETGWGHLEDVQVPMLECQNCGHDVICHFAIMEKLRRFWVDFEQDVVFGSGLCESLRHLSQRWSALVGGSVGLRTINERINELEPLWEQAQREPIAEVPTVVQLDGIWLTLQTQNETEKRDRGRTRITVKTVTIQKGYAVAE